MTRNTTTQAARVAGKKGSSLISDGKFRELYAALLRCSMLDERLPTSSSYERWIGREATSAGVVACLGTGDSVTPTRRGVLAGYLQNGSLIAAYTTAPKPIAPLATATGDALRHKLERMGNVTVVFAGAEEPDRMREIFASAASQSLPAFYVIQSGATATEVCGKVPVICVDASDAVAVYRVAHESITRARGGGGPTIMECAAWPDDSAPDPLAKLERYLAGKKLFRSDWKQRLERNYARALLDVTRDADLPKQ
jgi:TPP-dependent pyruvate/acetoin dehydrogenase alpha subunit